MTIYYKNLISTLIKTYNQKANRTIMNNSFKKNLNKLIHILTHICAAVTNPLVLRTSLMTILVQLQKKLK